jgi:pyruvoyl-dependent arginine decarboxylase (PvlArgDC)
MEEQEFNIANSMRKVPLGVIFSKDRGIRKDYLTSFELALRDA